MKAHELALALFQGPNVDVVLSVYGHRYHSEWDIKSHGALRIIPALLGRDDRPAIVLSTSDLNLKPFRVEYMGTPVSCERCTYVRRPGILNPAAGRCKLNEGHEGEHKL